MLKFNMKLNSKCKQLLIAALNNQANVQCGGLQAFDNYADLSKPTCVGGVLCRVMMQQGIQISCVNMITFTGLTDEQCHVFADATQILNKTCTFKQIADIIEKYL